MITEEQIVGANKFWSEWQKFGLSERMKRRWKIYDKKSANSQEKRLK